MSRHYHETAQICENGHIINLHFNSIPTLNSKYCTKCNAITISTCKNCDANIRGCLHEEFKRKRLTNMISMSYKCDTSHICRTKNYNLPLYCPNCNHPYPWTEIILTEINDIIEIAEDLDESDKAILKENFPNILIDSPRIASSALKISLALKSATAITVSALRSAIASKVAGYVLELLGWK